MLNFTKRQKSIKREALPLEEGTGQPTIQRLKKLPKVLSSSIKEKNLQIFEIRSPEPVTGFNEIAWKDRDGSKLYLENLDSQGRVFPDLKVTYPEVQLLAKQSGWTNSLPDTIYVNSGGGADQRWAAKKMVLGLLKSYQSGKTPPKPIILKETPTDNVGPEGLAIEFSVKNITQLDPIMTQNIFEQKIPNNPMYQKRFGLKNPGPIYDALTAYQAKLQAGVENGFRVEGVDAAPEARAMFQEIETAAQVLKNAIDTTIEGNPDSPLLTKLKTLQKQVESAINDGFLNELDTRRWQQWGTLKPRTEDEIVPGTKEEIGAGIQGAVFKYQLVPPSGGNPSDMILKYDSSGLNENAKGAGIPDLNPQQSVRAVAAYQMSQHLQLDIIPRTEVFVGTDDDGRPKLGQAIEFVKGTIGQRTVRKNNEYVDQGDMQKAEAKVKNPAMPAPFSFAIAKSMLDTKVKVKGKWYAFELFPTNIDYGNAIVQKGLSDLQVFDSIIGHSDRNPGNWIYEKDDNKNITRVKGIDNDDTFGERWSPEGAPIGGAIRGIPPIVDISTALSILNANFEAIRPLLAGLSDGEINQVSERLDEVKRQVGQRVIAGQIASMGNVDQATLDELHNKVTFIGPRPQPMPAILRWGDQGIAGYHTGQNSYLGFQLAAKNQLAQQYPETGGVVPESGDVFV